MPKSPYRRPSHEDSALRNVTPHQARVYMHKDTPVFNGLIAELGVVPFSTPATEPEARPKFKRTRNGNGNGNGKPGTEIVLAPKK
jgi:hypothetical protein